MPELRTSALTMAEIEQINAASDFKARRVADRIEAALRISSDADKEARLKARMCRGCFYVTSHFAGQAFTQWTCLLCDSGGMHSDTAVPRVCNWCSEAFGLCTSCGGDIEMRRRTRFDRKAKRMRKGKAAS